MGHLAADLSASNAVTPTQMRAQDQRRAFQDRITAAAESLKRSHTNGATVVTLGAPIKAEATAPLSSSAQPEPPRPSEPHWFFIIGVKDVTLRISSIIRVVAAYYQVSECDLLSARRTADIIVPRQMAAYLCKELTHKSLPEIGRRMGRDHTTVLHSVRRTRAKILAEASIAMDAAILFEILTGVQQ